MLIVNADDWGRDVTTTDRIRDCAAFGTVTSVSAMVFMEDSERAAEIALERGIEVGLHLNLTTRFGPSTCSGRLLEEQQRIARYLLRHRLAQVAFHPGLIKSFEYVVASQLEEFRRLYSKDPERIDGHHHMHLCANVLWQRLLPAGAIVRRNVFFGGKSFWNQYYRRFVDTILARRHTLVDYFFSLAPLEPSERLQRIISLATNAVVELEAHPIDSEQFHFLMSEEFAHWRRGIPLGVPSSISPRTFPARPPVSDKGLATERRSSTQFATPARRVTQTETRHITVCICTFQRPRLLGRLLSELDHQRLNAPFTFSVVVADNDGSESAREAVTEHSAHSNISIVYSVEPEQNIALARNKALEHAKGEFVAFIDDDEFPIGNWLQTLVTTCDEYGVDGVLGPVKPHFDATPPEWIIRGGFCERPVYETGRVMKWDEGRTGNILFRTTVLERCKPAFNPVFASGGEDVDFLKRATEQGSRFVWCNEAVVYEAVPPQRWRRSYMIRRALLRGRNILRNPNTALRMKLVGISFVATPIYVLILPIMLLAGQHHFMKYSIKLSDHLGRLLAVVGINPVTQRDP